MTAPPLYLPHRDGMALVVMAPGIEPDPVDVGQILISTLVSAWRSGWLPDDDIAVSTLRSAGVLSLPEGLAVTWGSALLLHGGVVTGCCVFDMRRGPYLLGAVGDVRGSVSWPELASPQRDDEASAILARRGVRHAEQPPLSEVMLRAMVRLANRPPDLRHGAVFAVRA